MRAAKLCASINRILLIFLYEVFTKRMESGDLHKNGSNTTEATTLLQLHDVEVNDFTCGFYM